MILALEILAGLALGISTYLLIDHFERRMRRIEAAFEVLRLSTLNLLRVLEAHFEGGSTVTVERQDEERPA